MIDKIKAGDYVLVRDIPDQRTADRIQRIMADAYLTNSGAGVRIFTPTGARALDTGALGIDVRDGEIWDMPIHSNAIWRRLTVADVLAHESLGAPQQRVALRFGDYVRLDRLPDLETAIRVQNALATVPGARVATDGTDAIAAYDGCGRLKPSMRSRVIGIDSRHNSGEVWTMSGEWGGADRELSPEQVIARDPTAADSLELQYGDYVRLDRLPDLETAKRVETALATVDGAYPANDSTRLDTAYTDDGRLRSDREHFVLGIDSRCGEIWTIPRDSCGLRRELSADDVLRAARPDPQPEPDHAGPDNSNSVTITGDGWSAHIGAVSIRIESETVDGQRSGLEAARRWLSHGMADAFADLES